jgi:hypothetical protein
VTKRQREIEIDTQRHRGIERDTKARRERDRDKGRDKIMWRFEGFSSMDGLIYVGVEGFQDGKNFLNMHVSKAPRREKGNHAIVESTHLSNMCATYNHHFVIYSKDKSKNTQLILNAVWKVVYASYKLDCPKSDFQEETLKERL